MTVYATINEDNICVGVSILSGKVENPTMIEITDYDSDHYLDRKYENGVWGEKVERVKVETYESVRRTYLQNIQDAQILGETEEVTKLQAEWQLKKTEFETTP